MIVHLLFRGRDGGAVRERYVARWAEVDLNVVNADASAIDPKPIFAAIARNALRPRSRSMIATAIRGDDFGNER